MSLARLRDALLFIFLVAKAIQRLVECKYLAEQVPVLTGVGNYVRDVSDGDIFGLGRGADLVHISPSAVLSD